MRKPQQRRHPHNLALAVKPKPGSRYEFLVRGMELAADLGAFDPWTPLEPFHGGMTRPEVKRAMRRNTTRMFFHAPFAECVVDWLVSLGMPPERLATPYTPKAAATIKALSGPLLDEMQRRHVRVDLASIQAPPHVRARALVQKICTAPTRQSQAAFLNHGAASGGGNLTRDHLDRAVQRYRDHLIRLGPREAVLVIFDYDVCEIQALERIYRWAMQRPDFRVLRGAALADAIHSAFDLAQLVDERMAAFPSPVRLSRKAA